MPNDFPMNKTISNQSALSDGGTMTFKIQKPILTLIKKKNIKLPNSSTDQNTLNSRPSSNVV